jgi:hypothetical protein
VLLGRAVLEQAFNQVRYVWRDNEDGESKKALESGRSYLRGVVDDFCGSEGPGWPSHFPLPPWPDPDPSPGLRPDEFKLDPVDLLIIGAQFQQAADALARNPLRSDLEEAADRLLEEGLRHADDDELI